MKLYYAPGASSLAAHIVLRELHLPFDLDKVDLDTHRTGSGEDYLAVNPKGYVPALRRDDGEVLTETATILQYLADLTPDACLAPPPGTLSRYRLMEWLNFIATEIHTGFGPLWNPSTPAEVRKTTIATLGRRFDYVALFLADKTYLVDDSFTIADAYLFTVLGWAAYHKLDLRPWPDLGRFLATTAARPAVVAAMTAEGLVS